MPTNSSTALSTVVAGDTSPFSAAFTITGDTAISQLGVINPVSATFTRFLDSSSGATLDIPPGRCQVSITSPSPAHVVTYTFAAPTGAYAINTMPPTVSQIPRGSSDLVLPSHVIMSTDFPDSEAYQVFSYVPSSLASVTAEFTIVVSQTSLNPGSYTFTINQVITRPPYLMRSALNLAKYI